MNEASQFNGENPMAEDQYAHWKAALAAGKPVETEVGNPRSGFYRVKNEAIAIWRNEHGVLSVWRSGTYPVPRHADAIDELFGWCAPHPVSHEDYKFFRSEGRWPDQVAPVAPAPIALTPVEEITREIDAHRAAAVAWLETINKTISSQGDADKAANYAAEFSRLEKRADELRDKEKRPHLEAGREVDATWKPVVERAGKLKIWAKTIIEPFLLAEKKRLADEAEARRVEQERIAKETREATEAALKAGVEPPPAPPMPEPPPIPQKAKAGTSGRSAHLRTVIVHQIVDRPALLAYIATKNELPDYFLEALQRLVNDWRKAAMVIPGVESKSQETVA